MGITDLWRISSRPGITSKLGLCQFTLRGTMSCAMAAPTPAFYATQVGNETRFGQRARRGKNHGMPSFVFPEFFKAHGFCPFHCHDFKIQWLPAWWQAL